MLDPASDWLEGRGRSGLPVIVEGAPAPVSCVVEGDTVTVTVPVSTGWVPDARIGLLAGADGCLLYLFAVIARRAWVLPSPALALVAALVGIPALIMAYWLVRESCNRTVIRVGPDEIRRWSGPLTWPGSVPLALETRAVEDVRLGWTRRGPRTDGGGHGLRVFTEISYAVWLALADGGMIPLVEDLPSAPVARFVARIVGSRIGKPLFCGELDAVTERK